jgi:hypothetical protein
MTAMPTSIRLLLVSLALSSIAMTALSVWAEPIADSAAAPASTFAANASQG